MTVHWSSLVLVRAREILESQSVQTWFEKDVYFNPNINTPAKGPLPPVPIIYAFSLYFEIENNCVYICSVGVEPVTYICSKFNKKTIRFFFSVNATWIFFFLFLFILPYALTDILGRLAQRLLVQDSKKGKIIVQRFKTIKVKDKNR